MKRAASLDDFVDDEPLVFSNEDIKEGVQKIIKAFGSFDREGMNKFYEKASVAHISWEQQMADGSVEPLPFGKVVSVVIDDVKDKEVWKSYKAKTDNSFDFWEEFYRQANSLIAKEEWHERKKMEELQDTYESIWVSV